jgi:hypothetical protein
MKFKLLILCLLFSISNYSQSIGIGGNAGAGTLRGSSRGQTSVSTSVFMESFYNIYPSSSIRFSFFHSVDINKILPETRQANYPSIYGLTVKGIYKSNLQNDFFIEAGFGAALVFNRIFSDLHTENPGLVFSVGAGKIYHLKSNDEILLSLGVENLAAFGRVPVNSLILYFQAQYILHL